MANPWREIGRYGSVGIELIVTIFVVGALGHWLDVRYWHDRGWGTAIGFLFGVAVGFRNLVRTAGSMQRDIERAEAKDPEAKRWKVDEGWLHPSDAAGAASDEDTKDRGLAGTTDESTPTQAPGTRTSAHRDDGR